LVGPWGPPIYQFGAYYTRFWPFFKENCEKIAYSVERRGKERRRKKIDTGFTRDLHGFFDHEVHEVARRKIFNPAKAPRRKGKMKESEIGKSMLLKPEGRPLA